MGPEVAELAGPAAGDHANDRIPVTGRLRTPALATDA